MSEGVPDAPAGERVDTAGVPWSGRTLPPGGFEGDAGDADPALALALQSRSAGTGSDADVVAALSSARLLVPVVAVLADDAVVAGGRAADKQADMALVTLTGPDGRRALPAFSSVTALARWDPNARPVPVAAGRAAASAVAEGCDLLVLDPAGPVTFVVSRPALWAVGQGRTWVPAVSDPAVNEVLQRAGASVEGVLRISAEPGVAAELQVLVAVRPGLTPDAVHAIAAQVGQLLQGSDLLRERVDGVQLAIVAA